MAAVENYANNATTTVTSGGATAGTSGTTESWGVTSSASFPAASAGVTQFHVGDPAQPSELIAVTAAAGTAWTVTRGAESTTPVSHAPGFTAIQVITAGGLNGVLPLAGGTMSGVLAMGSNKITGLANGTAATDAAAFGQVPPLPLAVGSGGSGGTAITAYAVVTGGTTATTPFQAVAGVGTTGQFLTSSGAGSLPSWQAAPGFVPGDAGFLEWNFDPVVISANTALTTTGTIYLNRVNVRTARSVSNITYSLGVVGSSLTSPQNFAGLYSSGGTLIATTADQTVNWNTGGTIGVKTIGLTGAPFSVPAGFVWVALMFNGSGGPSFGRAFSVTAATANIGFAASAARFGAATGGTVLPATINTGNNSLQAVEYWTAIS